MPAGSAEGFVEGCQRPGAREHHMQGQFQHHGQRGRPESARRIDDRGLRDDGPGVEIHHGAGEQGGHVQMIRVAQVWQKPLETKFTDISAIVPHLP
ncbi:hypothetical protein GCM10010176_085180 [Nonomuraea spiralis]|nr:hypothetical protein GCM10010176_085180 [Nonomuraea spiralis]